MAWISIFPYSTDCSEPLACAEGADALVLTTRWPQYRQRQIADLARLMAGRVGRGDAQPLCATGVFDLVHPGHIRHLIYAKSKADRIVRASNADRVIYMRPEHVLTEMPTFWDYGIISEYSPTTEPCILGDAHDFLMAELRSEGTFRELLHLGWPTAAEIAADLSSFTTQDHYDYGQHTLVLHSDDLPSDLDTPRRESANFVDSCLRKADATDQPSRSPVLEAAVSPLPRAASGRTARPSGERGHREEVAARGFARSLAQQIINELRTESRTIKELAALDAKRADFERNQNWRIDRRCAGSGDERAESPDALGAVDQDPEDIPRPVPGEVAPAHPVPSSSLWEIAGDPNWVPYHTMLRAVLAALRTASETAEVLVVSSGGTFGALLSREFRGRDLTTTPGMLASGLYRQVFRGPPKFDLCLCDPGVDDLTNFRDLFGKLRPFMKDHRRIIVLHDNLAGRSLDERTFEFTRGLFSLIGRSCISFTGSYVSARIIRWFASRLMRHNLAALRTTSHLQRPSLFLGTARSVCLQDRRMSKPAPIPGSLHEHDRRSRPPSTSDALHRDMMRSVCAASAAF